MSKFKVGDCVRVVSHDVAAPFGEVFIIREVMEDSWPASSYSTEELQRRKAWQGERWYRGDRKSHGVWENFLELVTVTS